MSADESRNVSHALENFGHDREQARKHWWMFLLLGIVLVLGGVVAIAYPCLTSVGAVMVLGIILILSGVFTIIGAFWAGKWSALFLQLLIGIVYVMAGLVLRNAPVESTALVTMFLATFFIVAGLFRIVFSAVERFPQWGWAFVNGVVTLLAGVVIFDSFTNSAFWLIGLHVGVELLINGWTWIMLSLVIRRIPEDGEVLEEENADAGGN
jgi:uncharacterized membrane protein HdeD (DUF308 family)